MHRLFVYGTLQLPAVMFAVTGKVFKALPARLDDYSRHRLRGKSYPGIRPNPGSSVEGLLVTGIDEESLRNLDGFEDSCYRRDAVTAITAEGGEWTAQAYVMREESVGLLLPEAWSLEEFQRKHLSLFLQHHA